METRLKRVLACCAGLVIMAGCATGGKGPSAAMPEMLPTKPPILLRGDWGAKDPVSEMKPHQIKRITIHHTATKQNAGRTLEQKMQGLQQFSQNEGKLGSGKIKPPWPDVPYHFYIDVHGRIAEGRQLEFTGDTNTEYDPTGHALIVLEGNFEEEEPTEQQWTSMRCVVEWLAARFRIAPSEVQAHNDFAQTLCPGKNLKSRLPALRAALASRG
jgi:hypothetical protein